MKSGSNSDSTISNRAAAREQHPLRRLELQLVPHRCECQTVRIFRTTAVARPSGTPRTEHCERLHARGVRRARRTPSRLAFGIATKKPSTLVRFSAGRRSGPETPGPGRPPEIYHHRFDKPELATALDDSPAPLPARRTHEPAARGRPPEHYVQLNRGEHWPLVGAAPLAPHHLRFPCDEPWLRLPTR